MNRAEILKVFQSLKNKKLIGIEYCDKTDNTEDSFIALQFTDSYKLIIQTFWRLLDKDNVLAMDTERYLLPDFNVPEKDYQKLPLQDSLLYSNIAKFKKNYLNTKVLDVFISDTFDLFIKLENDKSIQAIIHCRCNFYTYYKLLLNNEEIGKISFEWE